MLPVKAKKRLTIWFITGLVMIFIMLMIGGATRLTGSGLSMVDWSPIMGSLPPSSEQAWQIAFDQYKQFPEYQKVNAGMTLKEFKGIYMWEYTHRLWGRIIGVVFIVPFLIFIAQRYIRGTMRWKIGILFLLGALQGGLGWFMVKSGLKFEPHVSHWRLMLHLMAALLIMTYLVWLITRFIYPSIQPDRYGQRTKTRKWFRAFVVVLIIQIVYGAFMAGLKAGLFFNTWPDMDGYFIPPYMFKQSLGLSNFTDNVVFVQFIHRLLPWVLVGLFVAYFIRYRKYHSHNGKVSMLTYGLLAMLVLQIVIGILTLVNAEGNIPLGYGLMHQAIGVLTFILSVFIFYVYGKKRGIEGY